MALNLRQAVVGFLKDRAEQKFTARQIAEWLFETFPEECQEKRAKSQGNYIKSDADLVQQLVAEISSQRPRLQKKHPELKTTEGRPRKYYYSEKSDSAEVAAAESAVVVPTADMNDTKLGEHAMYPLLSSYLWEEFGVYSKRIDEKRSSNKRGPNGNRWLYPDLVGMEDLGADWHQEVRDCVNQYSDKRTKLWSFEVKLLINRSNVRECFFQSVSNSSWSNFGYLVAAEIEGQDTFASQRRLRMIAAIASLSLLGLALGTLLGVAGRYLKVEGNPLEQEIEAMMPGSQCGQCGYPGCAPAAAALVSGAATVTLCPPGGQSLALALADKLGVTVDVSGMVEKAPMVAYVKEDLCIGCTRCFKRCPTDAILGGPKQIHAVISDACTGCEKCVEACPTECVEMRPVPVTLQNWHWPKPAIAA